MRNRTFILFIVAVIFLGYLFVVQEGRDIIHQSIEKVEYSKTEKATFARARYEQYINERGGLVNTDNVKKSRSQYNKALASRKKDANYKDADIAGWDWLGPGNIGGRSRSFAIKPSDPDIMFFGSVAGGLWRSNDAGSSWTPVDDFWASLAITDIVFDQVYDDVIYVATGEYGSYGTWTTGISAGLPGEGIYKSNNGGLSWFRLGSTTSWKWIPRIATVPGERDHIYAIVADGDDNGLNGGDGSQRTGTGFVVKSTDGGQSWSSPIATNSAPQSITINPNNSDQVVVGCVGELYTNLSGSFSSANFVDILGQGTNPLPFINGRYEAQFGPSSLYVLINRGAGELWKSSDSGNQWTQQFVSPGDNNLPADSTIVTQGDYCMALWVDPRDDDRLVVGGLDLWRSTDGGVRFTRISDWRDFHDNNSAHADQHFITNHPDNSNQIFVCNDGGLQRNSRVFPIFGFQLDPTNSWVNMANTTLGVLTLTSAAVSIDGTSYIGGAHDNSYSYGTSSSNWNQPTTGDGGQTLISYLDSDIMYAAVQWMGLNKSTDGGVSWCRKARFPNGSTFGSCIGDAVVNLGENGNFYAPLEMDPNNDLIIYTGAQSLFRSSDGAESFPIVKNSIGSNSNISTIEISQSNTNIVSVSYTHLTLPTILLV